MERIDTGNDGARRFERDSETYVVRREEGDDAELSYHVLDVVSAVTGTPLEDLQPLYEVIDPDALEALFDWEDDETKSPKGGLVTFQYEGCDVTIRTDGHTIVSRRGEARP